MTRNEILQSVSDHPTVPVLIIGGGINGVGLLRELALQGVDVLLVERQDYGAGASAASTRIIHGGIRYLENGEFRLVRESIEERDRLLRTAPHYVKPLPTTIPIFSWTAGLIHAARKFFGLRSKPNDRGALVLEIGMRLYDVFSASKAMPHHFFTSRARALSERPDLNPAIVATATYHDAQISAPERLCAELVFDSAADHPGARALNYATVIGAAGNRVQVRDELSGTVFEVEPQFVVNATGAWIDFTNKAVRRETNLIGGTKGSHLVLKHPRLWEEMRGEMIYFSNEDGRTCIFYPVEDKIIAGATDIPIDDPDTARADADETEYILDAVRLVFPSLPIGPEHIVLKFSGVRPLPRSTAATPGQISRDHSSPILPADDQHAFPIINLIGGKWTTFRAFAEQVADKVMPLIGATRRASSRELAIGGGAHYPKTDAAKAAYIAALAAQHHLTYERAETLFHRYGTRAQQVGAYIAEGGDTPVVHFPEFSAREIEFLTLHEQVVHLEDIVMRRTLIGILGYSTRPLLEELAAIMGGVLGWDGARQHTEVEAVAAMLLDRHDMQV